MSAGRRFRSKGSGYEVIAAWRAASGMTLCYFSALEGDAASGGDRGDRRAALGPDEALETLDERRLEELLGLGAPLTATERRFDTPNGGRWLAQDIGPVWAEGVASGLTGVLFTDLKGSGTRFRTGGGPTAGLSAARVRDLLEEARRSDEEPQTPQ